MKAFKELFPAFSVVPDAPRPFGYKTGWLAIRDAAPQEVINALKLQNPAVANWESGLAAVWGGSGDCVFITPRIDGYVLVVGVAGLYEEGGLKPIAGKFAEMQFFATHRVSEFHCWAKYRAGELVRGYCYIGDTGEVEWDAGELTLEEEALGFDSFPVSENGWDGEAFPNEEDVLNIAAAWGVDTSFPGHEKDKSTGYVCSWPDFSPPK